ncbi:hypothetical protein ABZU32_38925 [Sphaerisporangium sp. NPDC005288]|uniref:hypothetical protein n=1 Tax=Sphaerisporangium sp. NPDC005288 TaxID=3155114 RepID=UPI0033A1C40B
MRPHAHPAAAPATPAPRATGPASGAADAARPAGTAAPATPSPRAIVSSCPPVAGGGSAGGDGGLRRVAITMVGGERGTGAGGAGSFGSAA